MAACRSMHSLRRLFSSLTVATNKSVVTKVPISCSSSLVLATRSLHISCVRRDLSEFFDSKENFGVSEVKVGRSWRAEELRIKSNADLHRLWFVLLKERNMLLTMQEECKRESELFPNPERIEKVAESMERLEAVVRERNRAYHELEVGDNGERPAKLKHNAIGLRWHYKLGEHAVPQWMNRRWHQTHQHGYRGKAVHKFLRLYREKLHLAKLRQRRRDAGHVKGLLKRFPHLTTATLEQHFPEVDVQAARLDRKSRGHHSENTA